MAVRDYPGPPLRTSRLARAVFLALCLAPGAWAQTAHGQDHVVADTDQPDPDRPEAEPADLPQEGQAAPAAPESPWIWVDMCIEPTQFCFTGVAARAPGPGRDYWEAELTPANLAEADINPQLLSIRTEQGLDWVRLDKVDFDESELKLTWTLPAETLSAQSFRDDQSLVEREVDPGSHPFTAALNYSASYGDRLALVGDLAVGKKYTSLHTSGSWIQDGEFVRGLTHLEHDQPARNIRWKAGEISVGSPDPLGASALIRGVSVERTFETSPTLITSARPNLMGTVDRSGTLEVYSNGQLISSRPVRPGPYTLEQLGISGGRQNISVVLRDEAGNRQTLMRTTLYAGSSLLAKGLSDFALRVGQTQDSALQDTNIPSERLIQGYWRRGMSDHWTIGARADVGQTVRSYGLMAAVATPVGEFSGSASTSSAGGKAWQGRYSFSSTRLSFSASHTKRDFNYRLPGEFRPQREDDFLVSSSSATVSTSILPRVSVALGMDRDTYYNGVRTTRQSVQLSGELYRKAQWNLIALRETRSDSPRPNNTMGLTVTVPFGQRQNVSMFSNRTEQGTSYGASYNRGRDGEFGPSYAGQVQRDVMGQNSGMARVEYQTGHALYSIQADQMGEQNGVMANMSGSLILAGGNMFATPPIGGSFAILKAPGAPGAPVVRENLPVGTTNKHGMALLRNLSAYYPSLIGFDANQLSIEMSPGDVLTKRVKPTPYTATVIEFNASPVVAAQIKLGWPDGTNVSYGQIVLDTPTPQTILIGREGMLWMESMAPGSYTGQVLTERGRGQCTFEIKDSKEAIQDLGSVVCLPIGTLKSPRQPEAEPTAPSPAKDPTGEPDTDQAAQREDKIL